MDAFLSPEALWQLAFSPESGQSEPDFTPVWRKRFAQILFECKGDWQPRYSQENAINNALEAISQGEQRLLLTLATGTGKTCIAFQLVWMEFAGAEKSQCGEKAPAIGVAFVDYKQKEFIEFVMGKYIEDGVSELAQSKMRTLIELKYNTISDAAVEFGSPTVIRDRFIGFQKHLYALR